MRTLLIVWSLLLIPVIAKAQVVPFDYTGKVAGIEQIGYGSNGNIVDPQFYAGDDSEISSNSDNYGGAQQFTLSSPTHVTDLVIGTNIIGYGDPFAPGSPTLLSFQLYSGTGNFQNEPGYLIPVNEIADSITYTITDPSISGITNESLLVPMDVTLQPGTYWVGEEGYGQEDVYTSQAYIDPPIVAPEPPTFWLLLVAVLGMLIEKRGRRNVIEA